jgi:hypothetical protein
MKSKKLLILCCSSLLHGVLFSCQVPEGINLDKIECGVIDNALQKIAKEEYNDFFNSQPSSVIKWHCLKDQKDKFCWNLFAKSRPDYRLGEEKK